MKEHDFLEAVGYINVEYINNACPPKDKQNNSNYGKWMAVVACLCVIVGGLFFISTNDNNTSNPDTGNGYDGTVLQGGKMPEGVDPIMASIAVYPIDARLEDVADASLKDLTEEEAYSFDNLGNHLPDVIIENYYFESAKLYETTMVDGTSYYMLRVEYTTGDRNIANYSIQITNFRPKDEGSILAIDAISEENIAGGFFNTICGDTFVGMEPGDLTYEEAMMVLNSID